MSLLLLNSVCGGKGLERVAMVRTQEIATVFEIALERLEPVARTEVADQSTLIQYRKWWS